MRQSFILSICVLSLCLFYTGCYRPVPGPDKTISGAILGAAWGTGAGAVMGNQLGFLESGAMVGGSFGMVGGMLTGIGLDVSEGTELERWRDIDALRIEVSNNQQDLIALIDTLDDMTLAEKINTVSSPRIFFDAERASLRYGSAVQLERIAQKIKRSPSMPMVELHGYAEDLGDDERSSKLSEARARTVATLLVAHGVSADQLKVVAHGANQPIGSNKDPVGRQLNSRVEIQIEP